jgi:hypothetical protein
MAPADALKHCQDAIGLVLANQQTVAAAEKHQSTDLIALDAAVMKLQAAAATGGNGTKTGAG